jgi:hypothetical protein
MKDPMICTMSAHQQPRRTNNGRTTGRSAIHKDPEGGTEETSQGIAKGASLRLPCGRNGEKIEKANGSYQTENRWRREQKDVVSNQTNGEGSPEPKCPKSPLSHKWRNTRVQATGRCQECHPARMQDKIFPCTQHPNHVNSAWRAPTVSI